MNEWISAGYYIVEWKMPYRISYSNSILFLFWHQVTFSSFTKKKNDWQSIENDYETNACIDWWQKSSDALLDIYKNTIYKILLKSERKIFFTYHKSPINRHYKIKFSAQWLSISLCTYIQYFIYFYRYWLDIFCFCCCSFTIWYCPLDTRWDS